MNAITSLEYNYWNGMEWYGMDSQLSNFWRHQDLLYLIVKTTMVTENILLVVYNPVIFGMSSVVTTSTGSTNHGKRKQ